MVVNVSKLSGFAAANKAKSASAWIEFKSRVEAQGGTVLEPEWLGSGVKHHVRCAESHDNYPTPNSVQQGHGICRKCYLDNRVYSKSASAETNFKALLAELGATLLEDHWLGSHAKHHVRCAAGHDCYPDPANVQRGKGICRECGIANRIDPQKDRAEAAFRMRLIELYATLLEPKYLGVKEPHHVRCAEGHDCYPSPASVRLGNGICRTCAGNDPVVAEANFKARLIELGATQLEPYRGALVPCHIRCAEGHDGYPTPASVGQGRGICATCAGRDPAAAEANFMARLVELGATLVGPYVNTQIPVHVRCAEGHDCYPRPNDTANRRQGICNTCVGQDPAVAESNFRRRLADLGATLVEPNYLGANTPHHVICPKGHDCYPRPSHVQQGRGICAACAGNVWDVFYVVTGPLGLKLGITLGDPKRRLGDHRRYGYTNLVRLWVGLPTTPRMVAADLEYRLKFADLPAAGFGPTQGTEHFDIEVLPVVLGIVDRELAWYPPLIGPGQKPIRCGFDFMATSAPHR